MEQFNEISPDYKSKLCGEQTIYVRLNWSRDEIISESESEGISVVYQESEDRPDVLIMQPTITLTKYSTVEFGALKCSKEYIEKERGIGCDDGTVAPMSTRCVYDIGRTGDQIGCASFLHLENCGDFKCPSTDYVKCPGDFCIPDRFVCDGIKQCRDGADELDCGCGETDGQVTIVYSGDASEVKRSYIYKFGRLFLSSRNNVRVVSLNIKERNVLLKSRTIHHSNEVLNQNKWQTHTVPLTRVTDFIVSLESSEHNVIVINDDAILDELDINNGQISFQEQIQTNIFSLYLRSDMRLSAMKSEEINRSKIFVKTWDIVESVGQSLIEKCKDSSPGVHINRCIGKFRCMSSMVCIPLNQVCDGIAQCLLGDDERLCDFNCPVNCSCGNYAINCSAKRLTTAYLHTLPTSVRSLDLSYSSGVFYDNNVSFPYTLSVLVRLNISSCSITDIADSTFEKTKNLLNLDLGYNMLKVITRVMFKGLTKLRNLILTGNNQLQSMESHAFQDLVNIQSLKIVNTLLFEIVPETFTGLRISTLDISRNSIRKIYDMAFSGLDVDTLKIDDNDITEFSRDIFTNMRNVRTIISPAFKFCCYRPDYVEGKNCLPAEDEFSSCEDLMRNSGLQTLLWVVGVSALVGNCLSIVYRLTVDKVRLKLGFGIFVTNLAISDFLMGVYLIIIAVADLIFRKRYIEVEAEWRTSNYCKLAGALATVSSEASVIFMCLITLDRILVIKFPFGKLRFRTKSALVCSAVGWVLAWGIALFPLMYPKLFDGQFYSKSGVCLALPLTRNRAPGWLYSVLIFVGLNFVTFILIAAGQAIIYLEIKKNSKRMKKMAPTKQSMSRRNDMVVARNLFLVLTTDFLCWFPIGVMALRALGGYPISGDVYAWTAVTVLPINAALNPILYTVTAILRRKVNITRARETVYNNSIQDRKNRLREKVFMNVTPKVCKADAEKRKDMGDFGQLLHRMIKDRHAHY